MNQEHLQPNEYPTVGKTNENHAHQALSEATASALCVAREARLERLQKMVSPKLYHEIKEKLVTEKAAFDKLLARADAREQALARYSFVLNPYFFEQRFFGE